MLSIELFSILFSISTYFVNVLLIIGQTILISDIDNCRGYKDLRYLLYFFEGWETFLIIFGMGVIYILYKNSKFNLFDKKIAIIPTYLYILGSSISVILLMVTEIISNQKTVCQELKNTSSGAVIFFVLRLVTNIPVILWYYTRNIKNYYQPIN